MELTDFEKERIKELKSPDGYENAAIYTVLLDLVNDSDFSEVAFILDHLSKEKTGKGIKQYL